MKFAPLFHFYKIPKFSTKFFYKTNPFPQQFTNFITVKKFNAMKKQLLLLLFSFLPLFHFAATNAEAILGTWFTEIKDAKVEIYKKGTKFHGRVVWIAEPNDDQGKPIVDKENPNANLKNRPILHMDILTNFVYDNDGEWDGSIYDPKDGKTYTCKLWVEGTTLKVRGYLGWLFDTKTWTKA